MLLSGEADSVDKEAMLLSGFVVSEHSDSLVYIGSLVAVSFLSGHL